MVDYTKINTLACECATANVSMLVNKMLRLNYFYKNCAETFAIVY